MTQNYNLDGVGSGIELGKAGPRVVASADGSQQVVEIRDSAGSLTSVRGLPGDKSDEFTTVSQLSSLRIASSGPQILAPRVGLPTPLSTSLNSAASSTVTPTAGTLRLWPFVPCRTLTVSAVQARVNTAGAGSLFRILAYNADSSGYPNNKIVETSDLSGATTGSVGEVLSTPVVLQEGVVYWTGLHLSTTGTMPVMRGIAVAAQISFPIYASVTANTPYSFIGMSALALGSAPATWSFAVGQFGTNIICPTVFGTVTSVS